MKKVARQMTDDTRVGHPEKKPGGVLQDPATNRPVVRDLRCHRFVAHQRERYFLNQTWEQ